MNLETIALKGYSTFPISQEVEPPYRCGTKDNFDPVDEHQKLFDYPEVYSLLPLVGSRWQKDYGVWNMETEMTTSARQR